MLAGERPVPKTRVFAQLSRLNKDSAADVAASAYSILEPLTHGEGPLGIAARQTLKKMQLGDDQKQAIAQTRIRYDHTLASCERVPLSSFIEADLSELVEPEAKDAVEPFARAVRARQVLALRDNTKIVIGSTKSRSTHAELPYPMSDDARLAIATALESIDPDSWGAAIEIGDSLWRSLRRQPVGPNVSPY